MNRHASQKYDFIFKGEISTIEYYITVSVKDSGQPKSHKAAEHVPCHSQTALWYPDFIKFALKCLSFGFQANLLVMQFD